MNKLLLVSFALACMAVVTVSSWEQNYFQPAQVEFVRLRRSPAPQYGRKFGGGYGGGCNYCGGGGGYKPGYGGGGYPGGGFHGGGYPGGGFGGGQGFSGSSSSASAQSSSFGGGNGFGYGR